MVIKDPLSKGSGLTDRRRGLRRLTGVSRVKGVIGGCVYIYIYTCTYMTANNLHLHIYVCIYVYTP